MKAPTWLAKLIIDVVDEEELLTPTPSATPSCGEFPSKLYLAEKEKYRPAPINLSQAKNHSHPIRVSKKTSPSSEIPSFTPIVTSPGTELLANRWEEETRANLAQLSLNWKDEGVNKEQKVQRNEQNFYQPQLPQGHQGLFDLRNVSPAPAPFTTHSQSSSASSCSSGISSESEDDSSYSQRSQNSTRQRRRQREAVPQPQQGYGSGRHSPQNVKTILCKYFLKGNCVHGANCSFAHGETELLVTDQDRRNQRHEKIKTKPCKNLHETGYCQFGPKCLFLHSPTETQRAKSPARMQNVDKLYKTEPCRHFFKTGVCMFGEKCMFAHGKGDRRETATPEAAETN